jgi:hypothetical protein
MEAFERRRGEISAGFLISFFVLLTDLTLTEAGRQNDLP